MLKILNEADFSIPGAEYKIGAAVEEIISGRLMAPKIKYCVRLYCRYPKSQEWHPGNVIKEFDNEKNAIDYARALDLVRDEKDRIIAKTPYPDIIQKKFIEKYLV